MKIGFIGLGKMGDQMVRLLLSGGHEVIVNDINREAIDSLVNAGAAGAESYDDLISRLGESPVIWMMVPREVVGAIISEFSSKLPAGSILIDGGNSNYKDTIRWAGQMQASNVTLVDVGTSGGLLGQTNGFCMMVGGTEEAYQKLEPLFKTLSSPNGGYDHFGTIGAGHYVKMVHNAIEYGMMQSFAEGYDLLKDGPIGGIDVYRVANLWQKSSIVESRLNELVANIFESNPELEGVTGYVGDTGEGRWAIDVANEAKVNMPALEASLQVRFASQNGQTSYSTKLLAALRNRFGGHNLNKS